MEEQKTVDVIFYTIAYTAAKEEIEKMRLEDPILKQITESYAGELSEKGIEVFEIDNNIMYTEQGYVVVILKEMMDRANEYKQMMYN
jgi:hypothetical protein